MSALEPLADEFYRLAHDDVTGKPRLHTRAVGFGLAAALLGELLESRHLTCWDGELRVIDRSLPADSVARTILDQLVANPNHQRLRVWLDFLSRSAGQLVAERLWRAGQLHPRIMRRPLMARYRSVRYVPTDINRAAWPAARISNLLRLTHSLAEPDVFLTGLVLATNLDNFLLDGAPAEARDHARQLVAGLDVARQELLSAVRAAAGDAVLCYRD